MDLAAILASLIFIVSLILIFTEKVNRTIVAFVGAWIMVGVGKIMGFYNMEIAIEVVDFETLALLLGMMLLVAMLEPTGFFEYLAVLAARASKGRPVRLFVLLGSVTTILSMFLDNVTTVVLIAPVTILISEILGISSIPFLIAEAILSNTGGVATLVGDPPNVLIASATDLSFNDFLIHSLPIVAVAWVGALYLLLYLFKDDLSKQPEKARAVMQLNPAETLNDPVVARRILVVLGGAVILFFLHDWLDVSPSLVALEAVAFALLWIRPDIEDLLKRVEWSVLVFFGALFVMVGGLEITGVLETVLGLLENISHMHPVLFGIIIIWTVAGLSAVVDNIPITIALIPVIQGLGASGLDIAPLWWALAFGAGFGGNGTIIGSTANIVVTSLSSKTRTPITSNLWN